MFNTFTKTSAAVALLAMGLALPALADSATDAADLARLKAAEAIATADLATFDILDFDVFNTQAWDRLAESHTADIKVHWPDGHVAVGLEQHITDLKAMFVATPDFRVSEHPIRIGNGEWTSVVGVVDATFTQPMPKGDGTFIEPNGNKLHMNMVTVGHWVNGVMDEEYLFWDSASYMSQLFGK
jgi:predicted ester cyclase